MKLNFDVPKSRSEEDYFQRYEFASQIARIVSTHRSSSALVVGLYGKWGEGKSSVMNFVEKELPQDTVVIKFNPWMFSNEQNLLRSFFLALAEALNAKLTGVKEKLGQILEDYSGIVGSVTQLVGYSTESMEKLGSKIREVNIEKLKERINQIILGSGKTIVIFIDDIDRLDVQEIQFMFKLVKLTADFPNTSYILAFDDEMVAAALSPIYGASVNKKAGYQFLDKIIQVPLKLPKVHPGILRQYTLELAERAMLESGVELSQLEIGRLLSGFDKAITQKIENPRSGLRYANSLSFSVPLLKGEVDQVDLMLIEAIKIFYPTLYDFIRSDSELFLKSATSKNSRKEEMTSEQRKARINTALDEFQSHERKQILELLSELFPQIRILFGHLSRFDDDFKKDVQQKRICSGAHFSRYFSYVVKSGDVSDVYFSDFLSIMQTASPQQAAIALEEALSRYLPSVFIHKLMYWEDGLNNLQIRAIGNALAAQAGIIPSEHTTYGFGSTLWLITMSTAKNFFSLSGPERIPWIQEVISSSASMHFAFDFTRELFRLSEKAFGEDKFSDIEVTQISLSLIERFKSLLTDGNFFELLDDHELCSLLEDWSSLLREDFLKVTDMVFQRYENAALKVLKTFTSTVTRTNIREISTFKAGMNQQAFESLAAVFDPKHIYDVLKAEYGVLDLKLTDKQIHDRDPLDDREIVFLFQQIYSKNSA